MSRPHPSPYTRRRSIDAQHTGIRVNAIGQACGVGKTALISRFCHDVFDYSYLPTIHDVFTHTIHIDRVDVKVEFVDTSGVDDMGQPDHAQIMSADACLLVIDLTNASSLQTVANIREYITTARGPKNSVVIGFVATKSDDDRHRVISPEIIKRWSDSWGKPIPETSAKRGWGVRALFAELAKNIGSHVHTSPSKTMANYAIAGHKDEQHWCCYIA